MLDLELSLPLTAVVVRELREDELPEGPRGVSPTPIKKLRDTHHALARCIAAGMRDVEASAVTGYSQSRISILKSDPTFVGLVAFYRENVNGLYFDLHERMATFAGDLLTELRERFEDNPAEMPSGFIAQLFNNLTDRVVSKPKRGSPVENNLPSVPMTMDLAKLEPEERAQVRAMIERRM